MWHYADKVKFVIRQSDNTAMLCSDNIDVALRWAGKNHKIIELDNKDFTVKILNASGNSYAGGKLSFWMCEVSQKDITFNIGINSEILCELMLATTFTNGVCNKPLIFARQGNQIGLLCEEMDAYKTATSDSQLSVEQTSKWEVGQAYASATKSTVSFGKFYIPFKRENEYSPNYISGLSIDFNRQTNLIAEESALNEDKISLQPQDNLPKRVPTGRYYDVNNTLRTYRFWQEESIYAFKEKVENIDEAMRNFCQIRFVLSPQAYIRPDDSYLKDALEVLEVSTHPSLKPDLSENKAEGRWEEPEKVFVDYQGERKYFDTAYDANCYIKDIVKDRIEELGLDTDEDMER